MSLSPDSLSSSLFQLTVQVLFLPEEWAHAFKYARKRYVVHSWNQQAKNSLYFYYLFISEIGPHYMTLTGLKLT